MNVIQVLIVIWLHQFSYVTLKDTVCWKSHLLETIRENNPRYPEIMETSSRSLLQSLLNCTVYHGDISINTESAMHTGSEEYVRYHDLYNLRNLQEIHGNVYLNLNKFPQIRSLSFFSSLRMIKSSGKRRGFTLTRSQVEMLGISNIHLNVSYIGIVQNHHLCYLENFESISRSSEIKIAYNKDKKTCAQEGKVCSPSCDPSSGCWGPSSHQCFACRYWRAGDDCVDRCSSRRGYFTPSNDSGRVCGRCHKDCKRECPPECQVCDEQEIWKDLWQEKPTYKSEMDSRGGISWTPRSLFKKLRNCSVYYGNIKIKKLSVHNYGFEEYIRFEDLMNLRNIEEIHGILHLDLIEFPKIKSLSFFSNLRLIQSSIKGFNLINSQVEMIDFIDVRLDVVFIGIGYNDQLCYMENFQAINRSSRFILTRNKDPKICASKKKVCSRNCNPKKGCWGPRDLHCFECRHWRAGDQCIDTCEIRRDFFTPSEGRICGRCHTSCTRGCFGPENTQCISYPEPITQCPGCMYFNDTTRRCKECSPSCFGTGYVNRSQLIMPACSGSGNWTGPGGCSFGCRGMTFITVSDKRTLECHPCHPSCRSGCGNASLSGCHQQFTNQAYVTGAVIVICVGLVLVVCVILSRFPLNPQIAITHVLRSSKRNSVCHAADNNGVSLPISKSTELRNSLKQQVTLFSHPNSC